MPTQRFLAFLEDVVLREVEGQVVLFFDEVDTALTLAFSDDFFTAVRSLTTRQAIDSGFRRLAIVIGGVASAADLVKDKNRTPFNVGKVITLHDFNPDQLQPFCDVLGTGCRPVVERIFHWTAGQPWMVQYLAHNNLPRHTARTVAWAASTALVGVVLWFVVLKPTFFPTYQKFQSLPWLNEDIHYIDTAKTTLALALPNADIRKITANDRDVDFAKNGESRPERQFTLSLSDLLPGPNTITLRYSAGLWAEKYEQQLVVVCHPREAWQAVRPKMAAVPAGCFDMGCREGEPDCGKDETPVHRVCLSAFAMARYEVTQGEWSAVMGNNPSRFSECGRDCPVENVSWDDTQIFLQRMKQLTGLNYRLPTEAEWEYAATSGGRAERYAGGNDLEKVGWFEENSASSPHPVGRKEPNGLGLFDMSGNVWEWIRDWYGDNYYDESPESDPSGPDTGSFRVFRGGSWFNPVGYCRAANRSGFRPGNRTVYFGFRLVLPDQQGSGARVLWWGRLSADEWLMTIIVSNY